MGTADLLEKLGFFLNRDKTCFEPNQIITFLGVEIDTLEMRVNLPDEKADKIIDLSSQLLKEKSFKIRKLAKLLGLMTFSAIANPWAGVYTKNLQNDIIKALRKKQGNYEKRMYISKWSRQDLNIWIHNIKGSTKEFGEKIQSFS